MTEIKLHTYGERLIVTEKVTLAAGNINSAKLIVTLDEVWAAYPNMSATFETKEYHEPVEMLMISESATEYACVIPPEVLQKQGVLEIGIRGISNDGKMAKTSSIAKYNIVRGATPGEITLKPTMDMYQQYLAAMDEKTAPLFGAYKAEIQAEHEKNMLMMSEEYARFKAALLELMKPVPLWTNPDPFNTKTYGEDKVVKIDVDLSKYKYFIVVFNSRIVDSAVVNGTVCSQCSTKGEQQKIRAYTFDGAVMERYYIIENDGITFSSKASGVHSYHGSTLVPYQVIGYITDTE